MMILEERDIKIGCDLDGDVMWCDESSWEAESYATTSGAQNSIQRQPAATYIIDLRKKIQRKILNMRW